MIEKRSPVSLRRGLTVVGAAAAFSSLLSACHGSAQTVTEQSPLPPKGANVLRVDAATLRQDLGKLAVKGRAPMTGYSRDQFGKGWAETNGCDTRDLILQRDLASPVVHPGSCVVYSGLLNDPYTGKQITFSRGVKTSGAVQIDHAVALGDAWQIGAQQLPAAERKKLANDPLELIAVDGPSNAQKGDGDAATWLPPNKADRCAYVGRQVLVKQKYDLWVTAAEETTIATVLDSCGGQTLLITD